MRRSVLYVGWNHVCTYHWVGLGTSRIRTQLKQTAFDSLGKSCHQIRNISASAEKHTFFLRLIRKWMSWYSEKLDTHPYLIKGITSGMIAASGDILCQSISTSLSVVEDTSIQTSTNSSWDVFRTLRFGVLGAFFVAPGCHIWYGALARWFPVTRPSAMANAPVLKRVIADQFIFTPLFLIGWLSLLWTLEFLVAGPPATLSNLTQLDVSTKSKSSHDCFDWYRDRMDHTDFAQIIYANWMLWIPVQALNFSYIPTKYQVLISNCVALVWNIYLSYMTSSNKKKSLASDPSILP